MNHIDEHDQYDQVATRPVRRRAAPNTNPLSLDSEERQAVDEVAAEIHRNLRIRSLSTYDQVLTFHAAILAMEASLSGDWNALAAAAKTGLDASFQVQNVSPYLICKQDEAKRNLASDQRAALKDLALRLGQASRTDDRLETDRASCLRAATYAAIAADRGLMHLVKENLGAILAILAHDDFPASGSVELTEDMNGLARRYRCARVRMP